MSTWCRHSRAIQAGFTLVEMMIGLLILTIGILAISGMVPTAYTNISSNETDTRALGFAQRLLDELRALPYTDVCLANGGPYTAASPATSCTTSVISLANPATGFTQTYQVEVNPTVTPSVTGLKRITVTVTGPRGRQIQLKTLITNGASG